MKKLRFSLKKLRFFVKKPKIFVRHSLPQVEKLVTANDIGIILLSCFDLFTGIRVSDDEVMYLVFMVTYIHTTNIINN